MGFYTKGDEKMNRRNYEIENDVLATLPERNIPHPDKD